MLLGATMKAVTIARIGGPEVLEYGEVPTPVAGRGEVLVKAHTIGVGKYDALIRTGKYPYPFMPELPLIPGIKMTGTVEALGPDVSGIPIGQRVQVWKFTRGCYAEYVACPIHELIVLPEAVDLEHAIAIPNFQVAWAMLNDAADVRRRNWVYMDGATGGVGIAVIQICRAAGFNVIAVVGSEEKRAFALAHGANFAINRATEDRIARVMEITGGRGVDLMLDHMVGPNFKDNFKVMAPLGFIVTFNALGGSPSTNLFDDLRANLDKSIAVRPFSVHVYDGFPEERIRVAKAVLELFAARSVAPAITQRLSLSDVIEAHRLMDAGKILGELVLKP
jgi:NADPH2:quinone reductase